MLTLGGVVLSLVSGARATEVSLTYLPSGSLHYRGEGKVLPQTYVNRFGGISAPLYRLDVSQDPSPLGYWSLSLWHTSVFTGGKYAEEVVPDSTNPSGGVYQRSQLNVGFTHLFVNYHRALARGPVEALAGISVVREVFSRRDFIVQNVDARPTGLDNVSQISAEGFGFGLSGQHGKKYYTRWQVMANYYVLLFDAKTDASGGQLFQGEGGLGVRATQNLSLEMGYLRQYWSIPSQGNIRLSLAGTDGAVISWNRQETRFGGLYFRLAYRFDSSPS